MRCLFAVVIWQSLPLDLDRFPGTDVPLPGILKTYPDLDFETQPIPNGLGRWFDFTFFAHPNAPAVLAWIAIPCLLLYASGCGLPAVLPILTFLSIGSRTLANSQGAIHHGFQMTSLALLAQTLVVLWPLAYRVLKKKSLTLRGNRHLRDYLVYHTMIVIAAAYVIAALTKLDASDGKWIQNSHYIGIQLIKTDRQNYYGRLEADKYGGDVKFAGDMLEHPNIARAVMGAGLFLELFAFLALYSRFFALAIGVSLVTLHQLVWKYMGLTFPLNMEMDIIFLMNLPFWVWWVGRRFRKPETPATQPA